MTEPPPIDVACPYGERWSAMAPEVGGRRCGRCDRHLVDLSQLTRSQAERFVDSVRGRVCAHVATDAEGRPVFAKRAARRLVATAAGVMLSVSVAACGTDRAEEPPPDPAALEAERAELEARARAEAAAAAAAEAARVRAEEAERERAAEEARPDPYEHPVGIVRPRNR